uniref:protein-serine/threonine phosphatase n=1 Tax=Anthurium amnicola TaxID=1678845 RepID=A0A1D1YUF3_9ARAE
MSEAEETNVFLKRASLFDAEDSSGKKPKVTISHIENSEKGENLDIHVSGENHCTPIEENSHNKLSSGECVTRDSRENNPTEKVALSDLEALNQCFNEESVIEADAAEDKGSRHSMEDAWVVLLDASMEFPGTLRCAHFAIYDGHGGRLAAEYAQKHLHENVLSAGLPHGCKSCQEGNP